MKNSPPHLTQPPVPTSGITSSALLTKEQVAQKMNLSVRTLEGLVAKGEFPKGVRVGRFLYWTESAISSWHQRVFAAQLAWRP